MPAMRSIVLHIHHIVRLNLARHSQSQMNAKSWRAVVEQTIAVE